VWHSKTMGARCGGLLAGILALGVAPATAAGQRYALLIGLNQHLSALEVPPLRFARSDVEALAQALKRSGYEVAVLLDLQARRELIVTELARYASLVQEDDTFILYYVGHAVRNPSNRQTYWLGYDTTLGRLDADGIRLSHLFDYVQDIRSRRKLVLFDTYIAGDLVLVGRDARSGGRDDSTVGLARGALSRGELESGLTKSGNMTVLASVRGDDFERDDLGHSVFAATLLEALNTGAADTNKDGALSVDELVAYTTTNIARLTQGQLKPLSIAQGFQDWLVVEGLANAETEDRRALVNRFLDRMQRWSGEGLITIETRLITIDVLLRWSDGKSAMRPADLKLLDAIKATDAKNPAASEALQAQLFEQRVRAIDR